MGKTQYITQTGKDRFDDFMNRKSGSFYDFLFQAIFHADDENIEKIRFGFPEEVEAYEEWKYKG